MCGNQKARSDLRTAETVEMLASCLAKVYPVEETRPFDDLLDAFEKAQERASRRDG